MKTKLFFAAFAVAFTACVACGADKVRYVDRQVQECFVDANGRQSCRIVTKTFAVTEAVPDAAPAVCPCVASSGSCPCAASKVAAASPQAASACVATASREWPVFFPRIRALIQDVREQRQERVQSRRAFLFGAYSK